MAYEKFTDENLVKMTLAGSTDAYGELVSRYKEPVFFTIRRILRDHHAAEDVAQDSFVDGYIQLHSLKEPGKFVPWICGIAKRKALHYITRHRTFTDIDDVSPMLASDTVPLIDDIIREENALEVRRAIEALSEKNRIAAKLYYFDGLDVATIARRLNLPVGTVKSRLYEARAKLKGELSHMSDKITLSPDFSEEIKTKIREMKHYYYTHGNDDNYTRLYSDVERTVLSEPGETARNHTLADLYVWDFQVNKDDSAVKKLKDAAIRGKNSKAMGEYFVSECLSDNNYSEWIRLIDEKAIPVLDSFEDKEGLGMILFWRGRAHLDIGNYDDAVADFRRCGELCPPQNIMNALSVSVLRAMERLRDNASDPLAGLNAIAESYYKEGTKMFFHSQPGFSDNAIMWQYHRYEYLYYYISRFEGMFYDTSLTEGETVTNTSNESFTCVSLKETVTVPAGTFEGCMHTLYREKFSNGYSADVWYCPNIGIVKILFSDTSGHTEEYLLSDYTVTGGEGYVPFSAGNRWAYTLKDLPDYLYQSFENEIIWTDGEEANFAVTMLVAMKKDYDTACLPSGELCFEKATRLAEENKTEEARDNLRRAVRINSSQVESMNAIGALEYLEHYRECEERKWRLCPSSYNFNILSRTEDGISINDFSNGFGPYRYGTRHEENRIFGAKPLRYLDELAGAIWNDKWVPGFEEDRVYSIDSTTKIHLSVENGGTVVTAAGRFENTLRLTVTAEKPDKSGNYYFAEDYQNVHCGTKVYWFADGVGIVKFDCHWGPYFGSSLELVSYKNPACAEGYMPLALGCEWEYDEMNLTREGYRAKRIMKIACGMNDRYHFHDMQEFWFRGTEEEYEEFKQNL